MGKMLSKGEQERRDRVAETQRTIETLLPEAMRESEELARAHTHATGSSASTSTTAPRRQPVAAH